MPLNIEIKAILNDRERVENTVTRLTVVPPQLIAQEDHFFCCDEARLKLRILTPDSGELIRYERTNAPKIRSSRYLIARTADPAIMLEILTKALGKAGVVRKERTLYLVGQTRVHLDQVSDLGDFLELEVVLRPEQSKEEGKRIADGLLSTLGINRTDIIGEAYVDLLARRAESIR